MEEHSEVGYLKKDEDGNIIIDEEQNVTCFCEGGLEFKIAYSDIDFSYDTITCNVANKTILIRLNENRRWFHQISTSQTDMSSINRTDINISANAIQNDMTTTVKPTPNRNSRKHMSATSRLLQTCQQTLETILTNIKEDKEARLDLNKQILAEYRLMQNIYKDGFNNINENLKHANASRDKRNELLEDILFELKRG